MTASSMQLNRETLPLEEDELARLSRKTPTEIIHSGHFMVSDIDDADNTDEVARASESDCATEVPSSLATPLDEAVEEITFDTDEGMEVDKHFKPPCHIAIDGSLTKLFECMTLAYSGKLTSPKWKTFKGLKLRLKDKIRLNNIIWRAWHMQFVARRSPYVCQFASPLEGDTHNKPEASAIVMEGKYWKRNFDNITAEYKKWRMFFCKKNSRFRTGDDSSTNPVDLDLRWLSHGGSMDEDFFMDLSESLFSSLNQPFDFPNPREIATRAGIADFIQPGLIQLQPAFEDFMDTLEPLSDLQAFPRLPASVVPHASMNGLRQGARLVAEHHAGDKVVHGGATAKRPLYPASQETMETVEGQYSSSSNLVRPMASGFMPADNTVPAAGKNINFAMPKVATQPKSRTRSRSMSTPQSNSKMSTASAAAPVAKQALSLNQLPQVNSPPQILTPNLSVSSLPGSMPSNSISPPLQQSAVLTQLLTSGNGFSWEAQAAGGSPTANSTGGAPSPPTVTIINSVAPSLPATVAQPQTFVISPVTLSQISSTNNLQRNLIVGSASIMSSSMPIIPSKQLNPTVPAVGPQAKTADVPAGSVSSSPAKPFRPKSDEERFQYKEHRRVCHINAEQKRRFNIKNGFESLRHLLPSLSQNPDSKVSKAQMLQQAGEYIRTLKNERQQQQEEADRLKKQIESFNQEIRKRFVMVTPRMDPSILEIADIIRYPAAEEAFLREFGLVPTPSARPQATGTLQGWPSACEYWGICKDLGFNPGEPGCDGEVVTYNRRCKKGIRPSFKCNRCKKQLSQLRGTDALHDVLGRPNVKIARRGVIWLTYAMIKGFSSRNTKELIEKEYKMSNTTRTDWRNYVREVTLAELLEQPPMGGVGQVVRIDERRNNHGGVSDKGPWIFGMLCVSTKEPRLFEVDKRDAATLGPLIAKNVLPGTTVFSDEWAAYRCIPGLVNANGTPLNLDWHTVNHSVNFIDPATGANTQHIESEWQKAKRRLVRNGNKTTPALMRSHLAWLWWRSVNARPNVKDKFLRLIEAIARRYPL
ncbi:hypothetical protein HPB52_001034 [Rhipicephalus sanguineus]|uniref:BHLH domain-containing protein n=1 Tax=Rhipicephalus sanguineus TaxID=34632 RepID=A0A9D4PUK2_RHISA|nr:hypothetical protein HPB52_001034 [Rhipicephalus sanguineus]